MALLDDAQDEAKMDMTPMIDAVFLLIIFFLCIDFKVLESKLAAYLPKDKGSQNERIQPQEQLPVQIVVTQVGTKTYRNVDGHSTWVDPRTDRVREAAYQLVGHQIHWNVRPRTFYDSDKMLEALKKIRNDKTTWQKDKETGELKPLPVVIEPQVGARYGDVARTVDAVTAAEFKEINFGGGKGAGAGR